MPKYTPSYQPPAVSLHRFGDAVAIALLRTVSTVYMEPAAARSLAEALIRMAGSVERERFTDSACGSFSVPAADSAADLPRLPRGY
jgi:hypothetical protein